MLLTTGSRARGLQYLWCVGLAALQHVGSHFSDQGIDPMSTALAGRFLTPGPPGQAPRQGFKDSARGEGPRIQDQLMEKFLTD